MDNQDRFTTLIVVVAIGLIFGSLLRLQPLSSANDRSRWSTVWSLNAGQGYVIDETPYPTIDKVKRGDHFYSSKPALLPTLIAGLVWAIGLVTGMTLPENQDFIVRFVLVLINLVPFAGLLVLYSRLLQRLGYDTSTVLYCLCAAGLGTYLTAYSVTLNNHTLAAAATFFALYCFIRIAYEDQRHWKYFAICGLCSAWAVANEMLALPLALVLMGWLFRTSPKATAAWFLPPAVLVGAGFLITLYLSTGGLIPYYLYFDTPLYQYEGSYWNSPKGIDAADDPKWFYLFNLVLGHHGVLSLTPVFILSFAGILRQRQVAGNLPLGRGAHLGDGALLHAADQQLWRQLPGCALAVLVDPLLVAHTARGCPASAAHPRLQVDRLPVADRFAFFGRLCLERAQGGTAARAPGVPPGCTWPCARRDGSTTEIDRVGVP